jgi:hypothetical protein
MAFKGDWTPKFIAVACVLFFGVDVFKLETDDIQNARMAFKGDWTPKFIAVACVLFFGGYIALVTLQDPANTDNGIVNLVLGYLGGIVSSIISFYYGASHKHDE